jgi:hypothetical protein
MLDLMPEGIRRRTQAGQRLRRFMAIGIVAIGAIIAFATHSQIRRDHLEESLVVARARAAQALKLEREAADMGVLREEIESYMVAYEQVALPMRMDALMGRIVAALPESATVDHLLLEYEDSRTNQRGRKSAIDEPRRIVGGVTGFAISDDDVAGLVQRMEKDVSFEDIRLDYTRSREVRGVSAREFQLTFTVNLEGTWEIHTPSVAVAEEHN